LANQTLKTPDHSLYDPDYADWSLPSGTARFGSTKTVDMQLPGTVIIPSRTYYVAFICAKSNEFVVFPNTAYIYAGFWLNNGIASYWIQGVNPFSLSGVVIGSPASTEDRKYRVFARTDRATSFLSTELDLLGAPDDAAFALGASVSLTWDRLGDIGIISYDVYRLTGATYELLQQVESGANTYLDNNTVEEVVGGYPTPTDDRSVALTTTRTETTVSVLDTMAVDGVSSAWSTISFPIPVPYSYDASDPAVAADDGLQWLRIGVGGLTGDYADLDLPTVTVTGGTVEADYGLFFAGMVGMTVQLFSDPPVELDPTTISVFTDDDRVTLADNYPDGDYRMYITGGAGPHCILIDCVSASYGDGATFANNAQDWTPPRPQFPRAAPNGSNQGGTGTGGDPTDGGGPTCVEANEPILIWFGNQVVSKRIGDVKPGEVVESGNLKPNVVSHVYKLNCPDIWKLETENGCSLKSSPSHPVYRNKMDSSGTPVELLEVGNRVLTNTDGRYESSRITNIGPTGKPAEIVMLTCRPTPSFVAGNGPHEVAGIVSHNRKPIN
jgi:hypothetical protein